MDNNVYLDEPKIAVAKSAWDAYVLFRAELTDAEAQHNIKWLHTQHVRKMLAADLLGADGTVIVTDIYGFNLALVDAHFPLLKQRQVTLMTRAGADFVVGVLARRGHRVPFVQ